LRKNLEDRQTVKERTVKAFNDFPSKFRGLTLRPGDAGYPKARQIYNMRHDDATPAMIARAQDSDDVVVLMQYASEKGVPVAIRSGGHSSDGTAMPDGALVLDMTAMTSLTLDPSTRICRAESGVLLGQLDADTQQHGLVVPAGTVSTTGVAGLTIGGGVGYNMRRYGATVDSLLACDVVTVDGRKVRASKAQNPDLLWALSGGGGNFGVVTAFEFKAHPVGPQVFSGVIVFPVEQAGEVLTNLKEFMANAPRELAVIAAGTACPPFPPVPAAVHGTPVQMLLVVYTGPAGGAQGVIDQLCALGRPIAPLVGPNSWVDTNRMLDQIAPYGRRMESRGGYLAKLDEAVIAAMVKNLTIAPAPTAPLPSTVQNLWFMGGAISEDFAEDSVAFSREGANWFWESVCQWDGSQHDDEYLSWSETSYADMKPSMRANGYVNLTCDLGPAWLKGLYGAESKYRRLVDAKTKWDPHNLLRFNKNFKPGPQ
jgi:FAD binding domain/Berberine and berberine like